MKNNRLIIQKNNGLVKKMVEKISKESPELSDLNQEQLDYLARLVITQNLTNELNLKSKIHGINYKLEKQLFLNVCSKSGSENTQIGYHNNIKLLETYCKKNGIDILLLTPGQADDFIYSLKGSPNTVRLITAAVSSFYSYLERRYSVIKNPIRGTKARPGVRTIKEINIPDEIELFTILNELPEFEKLAVYIMSYRGLRVGALNKLKVWGINYKSFSKGKEIYGEFPVEVVSNIKYSELNNRTPFENMTTNAIKLRIYRQTLKMYNEGKIKSPYSAHDFRHFFAVSEYKKDFNIYRVSKLLDHSNISITETYLRSLKINMTN